jgi:RNA polymerase sigma factor (TIGR02999 family)
MQHSTSGDNTPADAPDGRRESLDRLMPQVYDELRDIARGQLALRAGGGTLSTTGLVHEAYLKLATQEGINWNDRGHFIALSALAMRHVLVDRARARFTHKRGGEHQHVAFDDALIPAIDQPELLLQLSDAIDELAKVEPRLAQVVDCRFFGGLNEEEVADALGITTRTVQRDFAKARMLLRRALSE